MKQKHRPNILTFKRSDDLVYIIRRKAAVWLPTPDWLLFIVVCFVIVAPFSINYFPLEKHIESPPLQKDLISKQWHLDQIRARQAWSITPGRRDVTVAVIDSGIDYTHHDLAPNMWHNPAEIPNDGLDNNHNGYTDDDYGWDFIDNDGYPMAGQGPRAKHGTLVAGIIGAVHDSNGIDGVSGQVQIIPVRVRAGEAELDSFLPCNKGKPGYYLAQGIRYAVDNGAKVINLSLTASLASQQLGTCVQEAIWYAFDRGAVIVAASGNNNENAVSFPASMPPVIAVGAIDKQNQRLSIDFDEGSNYGKALDVVAPGVNIWTTTINNQYEQCNGTSFAAAQVAGLAALLFSMDPPFSAAQVRHYIETYTQKVEGYEYTDGWNKETGWGCIDVYGALQAASLNSPSSTPHSH
jgi:subtilisin family serine protease